jgi:hypothetical protein
VERRLAEQATAALRSASDHPDDVSLHEARVAVKKWRYTLECLQETVPGAARQSVRPLRRIQGELGDAHDRAMLREYLERYARRAEPADGGDQIPLVVGRLELERERAVRRFERLAAALIDRSPATPAPDRFPDRAVPVEPIAAAEPVEPAGHAGAPVERSDDGDAAGTAGAGPPGAQHDPREARWDRMATWLERTPRKR